MYGPGLVFGQSGCIRSEVVVLGKKWLYSGKICCIRAKVVYRKKWLYSRKSCSIGQKWFYSGRSGCIGQSGCIRANLV